MVGVRRPIEVAQVATRARRVGQIVVIVDVALRALHVDMRAREREAGRSVIESCSSPVGSTVAGIAGLRESRLHVVGIGRPLIVLQVA